MKSRLPVSSARLVRLFTVAFILIAATWLRVGSLATLPPGLSSDEAINANDAFHIAQVGPTQFPFYETYGEPEPLYRFILSLAVPFLGPFIWVFRLVSALIGVVTVAAAYWATGQILAEQPSRLRWIAAATAAASLTMALGHITLSRGLYRAVPLPLFILLFVGFLLRGLRRQSWAHIALSGLSLATCVYTYTAGFLVPFALAPFAVALLLFERHNWRRWLPALAVVGVVVAIVISPVIYLFTKDPVRVLGRAAETANVSVNDTNSVFSTIPTRVIEGSRSLVGGTFSVLVVKGDGNVQYNADSAPVVPIVMLPLFVIGLFALIAQWYQPRSWLLFSLIFITAVPAVLSIEPAHGLRITGEFAVVPLLIGLGTSAVLGLAERFQLRVRYTVYGLLAVIALIGIGWARQTYVNVWQKPSTIPMFGRDLTYGEWFFRTDQRDLAEWINDQSDPMLVPVDQLLPQTTHAWLLSHYPTVRAADANFVLPANTQIVIPWTLELGDFNTNAYHFALLDQGTITLLPPLADEAHKKLLEAFDSALLVTRANGNPLVKVISTPDIVSLAFESPQVMTQPDQPLVSLPNGLLVTGWWGPNMLSGETEQIVTYMLNWATTQPQRDVLSSFVGLLTVNNERKAGVDTKMTRWLYPTWTWQPNTPVPVTYTFTVPAGLDPGAYRLALIMGDELTTVGWVKVPQAAPPPAEAGNLHPDALFNNEFRLYGAEAMDEGGGNIHLSLYWQSQTERSIADAIIFVHVQGGDGAIIAQADAQPWGGQYPTFIWSQGERVQTDYSLNIGETLPEEATIWIGMYTFPSLARLEVSEAGGLVEDNRLKLGSLAELLGQ